MYTVCGYDKDNDVYETYLETDSWEDALQLGRNFAKIKTSFEMERRNYYE